MIKPIPQTLNQALQNHGITKKQPTNGQWLTTCPSHQDNTPSLAIRVKDDGKIILHCHAGCQPDHILNSLNLTWNDLQTQTPNNNNNNETWTPRGNATDTYTYTDEHGEILYQVLRIPQPDGKKTFTQRQPHPEHPDKWIYNLKNVEPVLYHLPQLLQGIQNGEEILICEGEKDVHTAEKLGHTATTNSGGAGRFPANAAHHFSHGSHVLIISDNDTPGRKHAQQIQALLTAHGANVRIAEPPQGSKDLTEHINNGGTLKTLNIIETPDIPDNGLITIGNLIRGPEPAHNWLIEGLLEKTERLILTASEGGGKALPLHTPIPTPNGWTTMGQLQPGDTLWDRDGQPTTITRTSHIQHKQAHLIEFGNGHHIIASGDHQWVVSTNPNQHQQPPRQPGQPNQPWEKTRTTQQIMQTIHHRHHIPNTPTHHHPNPHIDNTKPFPENILNAPHHIRQNAYQQHTHNGKITIPNRHLQPWRDLYASLGHHWRETKHPNQHTTLTTTRNQNIIKKITPLPYTIPMKCVTVNNPSHTYLAGEHHLVTHNSTWLRQFAALTAAGIHPLIPNETRHITHTTPRRVLWVDAENSLTQNKRAFTPIYQLTEHLNRPINDNNMLIALKPEGLDLSHPDDQNWLETRITIAKPDLVVIGPWYRLLTGEISNEKDTRNIITTLDRLRVQHEFTLIIEAHSPHAAPGSGHRPLRPIGSSILLRWPEYGYSLTFPLPDRPGQQPDTTTAEFLPWRGSRDQRPWPATFTRGTHIPWLATD